MNSAEAIEGRIEELKSSYRCEHHLDELLSAKLRKRANLKNNRLTDTIDDPKGRLETFFKDHLDDPFTVSHVKRLRGGGANESYSFNLTRGQDVEKMVLRVKTLGACCATSVEREAQMMQVVQGIMPSPKPHWLVTNQDYFGEPALICSFIPGVSVPSSHVPMASGLGVTYGESLRKKLAPQFIEYLAKLHSYDWSEHDLSTFDLPRPNTTEAIDWRLAFWERSWEQDKIESHPTVTLMKQWLWEHRPEVDHVSLLHGDFRNGNFLFDEESGKINAIVDWELCFLGDRHSDLAYTMRPAWGSFDEKGTFLVAGLVDAETFLREYERISGLKVDHKRLHYYLVCTYFRSIVSLVGSGVMNADLRTTQLDVMYNFISGLGGRFLDEVNKLILEDYYGSNN